MKFLMRKISTNCLFSDAKKDFKSLHFRKSLLILCISFIVYGLSGQTPYFEMDSLDSLYRIENQKFGESIVIALNYRAYPFLLQCCHGTPYNAYRYELKDAGGGYYYLHNMDSGHYLSMPDNHDGSRITSSAGASGDLKKWKFKLVNPKGLYSIQNKASGLYLSAYYPGSPSWNPYLTRLTEGDVVQKAYVAGDKNFLWAIEPERGDAINCIGMSQIGWEPSAQKIAVLNRTSPLGSEPAFTVTKNGTNVLSGTAVVYQDQNGTKKRYKLHYYAMNLTELTTPGEYELSVAGQSQKFVVNDNAYWKLRHRYGLNTTRFSEFFDPDYGFITHWARLANWYTDYRVLEHTQPGVDPTWHYPYWQKITVVDGDPGHNTYADIQPQKHLDNFAMGKGWNHTDQQWCFFAPSATTLIVLTELWHYNPDSSATQPILDEILYGVNSLLDVQHPAGNFPQNTFGDNAYTGTVAACGHALAAAYEPLNSFNPGKAQAALAAAKKAWDWVEAHNSTSDWVPYNTQFYRYAFAQERMQLNVELYIITGDQKYKNIADSMISNSKFDGSGRWVSSTGTRFPGEEYYPTSSAVWGLFRYYSVASATMKAKIRKQLEDYYVRWSYGAAINGPYNEGAIHTFGDSYHYVMKAVIFFKIYELFGDKYGEAYNFAEKNTDWLFGYNHFGTSLVFGCGDIFATHGYGSGYNYGRVVPGLILENAQVDPNKITASNHSYNVGESGAVSQVLMMLALSLRERLKSTPPRTVEMYPNTNNGGYPYKFSTGKWRGFQIRREGMHLADIESMKIPAGFKVYAYEDENLTQYKTTYTSSTGDLGGKKNKIKSFEIVSDDNNNHNPEITSMSPADQSSFAAGATISFSVQATDAEDGTIDDSRVTWYSALDGFIGTGKSMSATLSTGTHVITVCVKDKNLASATKSITIFVGGFNSKPVAVDDSYSSVQDTTLNIAAAGVLTNDSDVDNDPLTAVKKSDPSHGTLTLNSNGSFTYTPNAGFVGHDTFTYVANDGTEDSSTATVTINVASASAGIPLQVPGCALWLDGSDVNATGTSPGAGNISVWHDKSGNGRDASGGATLVQNAYNNLPAVNFDGQSDAFSFTRLTDIRTVFWVVKEQNQTSGGSPNLHFLLGDANDYYFHRGDTSLWNGTHASPLITGGTTRVDRSGFDGTASNIPENQLVLISLKTTGNVKAENITTDRSFGRSWDGDIAEIIIYNQALTTANIKKVEDYLYNKWFGSAPQTYSVSGTITGDVKQGVSVKIDATHSATTDAGGKYTIGGLNDGSYTVTPTLAGYSFSPLNKSVTISGGNKTGVDFSSSSVTYSLTVNNGTGSGPYAENASVQISATVPAGKIFDAWTGDTQYLADASSASTTVTMPAQDVTVTATFKQAPPNTHSISGTISGDILAGVTVAVDTTHSATSDSSGNYTIGGLSDGSYTVTPTLAGYTFAPANKSVTLSGSDKTGVDFTASSAGGSTYSISGKVSGDIKTGVTVVAGGKTATTDGSGNYTISGLADGGYTVTPSHAGYSFSPASKVVTVSGADVSGINFSSTQNGSGGGITDPTDIAGCIMWLDGADPNNDGNPVAGSLEAWKNKADADRTPYQPDPTNQASVVLNALNGHSIMEFAGGNQTYDIIDPQVQKQDLTASTFFWVLKENNINEPHFFMGYLDPNDNTVTPFHRGITNDGAYAPDGKYWDDTYSSAEVRNGSTYLDGQAVDGQNDVFPVGDYHIVSLVATGPVTFNQITQDRVYMGNRSWDGGIAEIIAYNSALSDADRQSVEDYLQQKWFGPAAPTYSISGTVTGDVTSGVTVSAGAKSATTDSSGSYTISGLVDGTYTVTPSRVGYDFTPATKNVTVSGSDMTGIDFVSAQGGGGTPVTDPTDIAGCVMWLDGADPKNDGNPVAGSLEAWKNKADPDKTPYQPDPTNQASVVLNGLNGHSIMDFVGGNQTYDIIDSQVQKQDIIATTFFWVLKENNIDEPHFFMGYLDPNDNTVTPFHRGITNDGAYAPDGKYWDDTYSSAEVRNGSTYLDGQAVDGVNDIFPVGDYHIVSLVATGPVTFNQITQDRVYMGNRSWDGGIAEIIAYSGALSNSERESVEAYLQQKWFGPAAPTYSISGTVTGDVTSGVTVSAGAKSATTDSSGSYTISGLVDGTYTVTPSRVGYDFTPATKNVTVSGSDMTGIDFVSAQGGGSPVTDPTDIAGCVMWLDGADPKNDGNPVAGSLEAWKNKADPDKTPYQPDPTNQASVVLNGLNGHSIMDFVGGNQTYDIIDSQVQKQDISATTFFWVLKENNIDEPHFFMGYLDPNDNTVTPFHRGITNDGAYAPDGKYWDDTYSSAEVRNGSTYLDGQAVDGVNDIFPVGDYHIVSLVATGPVTFNQITQDRVYMGNRSWDGGIAEIIAYSGALSNSERESVEAYLQQKWFGAAPITHVISGNITENGSGLSGVTVTAGSRSANTDASGNYSINNVSDGTYTVTPTLAGYTFTPSDASVTVAGADVTGIDFTATASGGSKYTLTVNDGTGGGQYAENDSVNISATVPAGQVFDAWTGDTQYLADASVASTTVTMPAQDVTVTATFKQAPPNTHSISGTVSGDVSGGVTVAVDSTHSATTDASGKYTISGLSDGSYTVTPTLAGYTFAPASASETVAGADVTGVDFVSTQNAPSKFTLTVNDGTGGGQYAENDSVNISATVPAGQIFDAWTGDTQYLADASAASTTVTMPAQDVTVTATFKQAPPNTHSISGTVSGDVSGGVTVAVDSTHSATTDASGKYTISGLSDGSYTVTPTLAGYTFTPATATVAIAGADITGIDFTSSHNAPQQYNLTVNDGTGGGKYAENASVQISATVPAGQVFDAWTGDTQYLADASAASTTVTMPAQDVTVTATFKQAPPNTHSISGTVTGDVSSGVTVAVDLTHSATTDASGDYTISGLVDGTYIVTPVLAGYTFTPATASVAVAGSNVTGIDFTSAQNTTQEYTLTVNNGTGGGKYAENASVQISATVPAGQVFDAWTGDTQYLADPSVASTTVAMPALDITVTATFKQAPPNTHTISGTISGDVLGGVTVAVDSTHSATTDASGKYIISGLADGSYTVTPVLAGYSFSPVDAHVVIAGADIASIDFSSLKDAPLKYALTVNNGTGSGQYEENDSVQISPTVPAGEVFNAWTGDTQYIADASAASTTVTMPALDITVTATFKQAPPNSHSISGTVSGDVTQGVIIAADATHSATTDASGNYTITGLVDGSYTVTPTLSGYSFSPVTADVAISGADVTGIDFTATTAGGNPTTNNPPVAADDSYFVEAGQALDVPGFSGVLTNDIDPDGDILTAAVVSPLSGLSLQPDGGFTYNPSVGSGVVSFSYNANDGKADSNTAIVTITIIPAGGNVPPTAIGDKYNVAQDSKKVVNADDGVLANDMNATGMTATVLVGPKNGTLTLNADGSFEYIPNDNYSGVDSFSYSIDGTTPQSSALVALNVAPVKVSLGSVLAYKASDVSELAGEAFAKAPKLYGIFENGKKGSFKKIKTSTGSEFSGAWGKKFTLYNKKAVKGGYKSYFDSNGPCVPAKITVMVKGKTAAKAKIDAAIQIIQLVPPVITGIQDANGNSITEASAGDVIVIVGKFFGNKPPKVALEVGGKLLKCKVDKAGLAYPDYKGKPSAMDPLTGESSVRVILPLKKLSSGTYPIVLDNKVGIATTSGAKGTLPEITIK